MTEYGACGMTEHVVGFTLVELLVVVLIIGILAAVALPEYKFSVDKTRFSKLISMVKNIIKAEEVYYLSNGKYTSTWSELDISFPGTVGGVYLSSDEGWKLQLASSGMIVATDQNLPDIVLYAGYSNPDNENWTDRYACYAKQTSAQAQNFCHRFTGKNKGGSGTYQNENYDIYWFKP